MLNTLSRLCTLCSSINFSALVWPTLHGREQATDKTNLGDVRDVRARASGCEFCHLIISRLDQIQGPDIQKSPRDRCWLGTSKFFPDQLAVERSRDGNIFIAYWLFIEIAPITFNGFVGPCLPDRYFKPGVRNPSTEKASVQSRPWTLMHLSGCVDPVPHVDTYCQQQNLVAGSLWERRYSGRLRDPVINLGLPRRWLQLCMSHHQGDCYPIARHIVDDFRAIDVDEMAIVRPPKACQYAALSYCWGSHSTVLLQRGNIAKLSKPGSLKDMTLPNTISDAITLTRGMGVRYLWVDALCIVQDDANLLLKQIPQMAHIYEQSVCTIMAAAARNADDGLAGVRVDTRAIDITLIRLPDLCLMTAAEDPKLPNDGSRVRRVQLDDYIWRSRAWTLQEEIVSRRKLFVEGDRIFWCCSHGIWTEETEKELTTYHDLVREPQDVDGTAESLGLHSMAANMMDQKLTPRLWRSIIADYSRRQLSFSSDAINAISGILLRLGRRDSMKFAWGHPERWFSDSLSWTTNFECLPNAGLQKVISHDGSSVKVQIPSWSWAAWVGSLREDHIHFKWNFDDSSGVDGYWCPTFYRCTLDAHGNPVPYACINFERFQDLSNAVSRPSWVGNQQGIEIATAGSEPDVVDSGLLQCWTSIAIVYIGREPTLHQREPGNHVVLNRHGIRLDSGTKIQSLETLPRADETRYKQYPIAVRRCQGEFVQGVHQVHALVIKWELGWAYVLIVEKVGNIYYRRGVCTIEDKKWTDADPVWMLVTLG